MLTQQNDLKGQFYPSLFFLPSLFFSPSPSIPYTSPLLPPSTSPFPPFTATAATNWKVLFPINTSFHHHSHHQSSPLSTVPDENKNISGEFPVSVSVFTC
jgi:hypothetical protein